MKFREVEKNSKNPRLFKVFDIYQHIQRMELPYPKAYDSKRDLFNHERALIKENQLQLIHAPLISEFPELQSRRYTQNKPSLIDKRDSEDQQTQEYSDQQRLFKDWRRMVDDEKLTLKSINHSKLDNEFDEKLVAMQLKAVLKDVKDGRGDLIDQAFCSLKLRQGFAEAKNMLREKIKEKMPDVDADSELKDRVLKASFYQSLNEGLFNNAETLQFAQLHKQAPFVKKSTVGDTFWALLMTNSQSKQNSMIEWCMWYMIKKLNLSPDDAYFFTSLNPDPNAFMPDLKVVVECNEELAGKLPLSTVQKALEPIQMMTGGQEIDEADGLELVQEIDDGTDNMGVMLYYGDFDNLNQPLKSQKYDLLNHCILSLQTVHHKGSVVLKVPNSFSLFNASLIFLMYQLFHQITITKPYAGDFSNGEQYVICTELRIRRPKEIIKQLKYIRDQLATTEIEGCIELKHLDDEQFFLNYLQQGNDELLNLQTKLLQRALKSLDGLKVPNFGVFKMKEQLLTSFDLPCTQKESDVILEAEFRNSQSEGVQKPKEDIEKKLWGGKNEEEQQRYIKSGDNVLKQLEEQEKINRRRKKEEERKKQEQRKKDEEDAKRRKLQEEKEALQKVAERMNQPKTKPKKAKAAVKADNEIRIEILQEESNKDDAMKNDASNDFSQGVRKRQRKALEKSELAIVEIERMSVKADQEAQVSIQIANKQEAEKPKELTVAERVALAKKKLEEKNAMIRKAIDVQALEKNYGAK